MAIFFTDYTALSYWRWHRLVDSASERPHDVTSVLVDKKPHFADDIRYSCERFREEGQMIEVLISSAQAHRNTSDIRYLGCPASLPRYSFARIGKGVYVATPQHIFVRLSRRLDLISSIKLGCDLTSTYIICDEDVRGFATCAPITSLKTLVRYIDSCSGYAGIKQARVAVKHVTPNAASPLETELAMLLSLPKRYGGYGLPKPELNVALEMNNEDRLGMRRSSIVVDILWKKEKLAIEYDSNQWHSGDDKFIQDSKRRNDIRHLGYDVTTVTYDEISRVSSMDRIASDIRKRLGVRSRRNRECYETRKLMLRTKLKDLRSKPLGRM